MGPAERPPEDGCGGDHLDTTDAWVEDAGGPLSSLGDWMRLLSGVERRHASGRVTVDAYGDGDRPYLVIEKYLSRWPPRAVDQYVVLPHGGPRARLALLGFIADCIFDPQFGTADMVIGLAGFGGIIAAFIVYLVTRYGLKGSFSMFHEMGRH